MRVETENLHGNYSLLRTHRANEMLSTSALNKACNVRQFIFALFVICSLKVLSLCSRFFIEGTRCVQTGKQGDSQF